MKNLHSSRFDISLESFDDLTRVKVFEGGLDMVTLDAVSKAKRRRLKDDETPSLYSFAVASLFCDPVRKIFLPN